MALSTETLKAMIRDDQGFHPSDEELERIRPELDDYLVRGSPGKGSPVGSSDMSVGCTGHLFRGGDLRHCIRLTADKSRIVKRDIP